jgi:hypothetical protein
VAGRGVEREQALALDRRFADAFNRVVARWPQAFAGTEMDPDANRKQLESLVKRMEDLAASLKGPGDAAEVAPTARLATMLKEALAANTIGGKVDVESRRRAMHEDVRQAQASWSRVDLSLTMPDARLRTAFSARSREFRRGRLEKL